MTAPQNTETNVVAINLRVAQHFLSFEKQPEKGVKGTNRKFSPLIVNDYAVDMLTDQWEYTHQGLAFTGSLANGTAEMKDGGHRMRALIQAATVGATDRLGVRHPPRPDLTIEFMVTEGLSENAWQAMDIGKRRQAHDFLTSRGETNTLVLASTVQLAYLYKNYSPGDPFSREYWSNSRLTPTMREQFLVEYPHIRASLYEGARLSKVMKVSAASVAHFLALEAGIDETQIKEFMDRLRSGVGLIDEHDPILKLRNVLLNSRTKRNRFEREEELALFIKAFNAFRKGETIYFLSFRTRAAANGSKPEAFPRFVK